MNDLSRRSREDQDLRSGTGALCAEAQADGVPCTTLGVECAQCERAVALRQDDRARDQRPS